jgi:hypothetical protein
MIAAVSLRLLVGAENPDTAADQRDCCERTDLALAVIGPAA